MKATIEEILRDEDKSAYEQLQHDRNRLTCFFEKVEKLLDPASKKLREVL